MIPRGTTYRLRFDTPQRWLTFYTPGEIETPNRYRNRYGQLLEHAPFSQRDFHPPPSRSKRIASAASSTVKVRVRGGHQDYVLDYHPLDVVGWDGYVYPYTFNIADFEPKAGRLHQPPPAHQTFQGPNFVICSFCPRDARLGPAGDRPALPPLKPAVRGDDLLRRRAVRLAQGRRRRGDHAASVGPAARAAAGAGREVARASTRTEELAVMCDTFRPLKLTTLSRDLDDPAYAYSWYEETSSPSELSTTG